MEIVVRTDEGTVISTFGQSSFDAAGVYYSYFYVYIYLYNLKSHVRGMCHVRGLETR